MFSFAKTLHNISNLCYKLIADRYREKNKGGKMPELKCKDLVKKHFDVRISDLRDMFDGMRSEDDAVRDEAYTQFCEYGLCFDYVAPGTFKGQKRGYFRYQISWGGPSEEFRYYTKDTYSKNGMRFDVDRVEFWYLDWFDGAKTTIKSGDNFDLLLDVFSQFQDTQTAENVYTKAMEDME